ncbi:MAG: ABC transporter permease [Pseudomonadota bacterium]
MGPRSPYRVGLFALCAMIFAFLILPIAIIVPLSFNAGEFFSFPLEAVSLRWYGEVLSNERWGFAARNSLIVGVSTTLFATALGTMAALGIDRLQSRLRAIIVFILISPMVVPLVIVAVAVFFFYARFNLVGTFVGLIMAHTALALPFVVITVLAALQGRNPNLPRAAASLGAPPIVAFFTVTLPVILPGVVSGALLAFATSFDEIVVTLFLAAPQQTTLPREIFSGIRQSISPAVTAVATMLIAVSILLMGTLELIRRRTARYQGAAR